MTRVFVFIAIFVLGLHTGAEAQQPPWLVRGDSIRVKLSTGRIVGSFLELRGDSLFMSRNNVPLPSLSLREIEKLEVNRPGPSRVLKSTLIGFGIGFGIGAFMGLNSEPPELAFIWGPFIGAAGAIIGFGFSGKPYHWLPVALTVQ